MEKDLKNYTRVTEIVNQFTDFSHIPFEVLENKRNIGSDVHLAIESEEEGFFHIASDLSAGYIESYRRWKDSVKPKFKVMEKRFFDDDLKVTGQVDAIVKVQGLEFIVDFKTSASANKEVWPLQAHFYWHLTNKNEEMLDPRVVFIKLDKEGKLPKIYEYEFSLDTWKVCLAYLEVYKYRH